MAKGRGQSSPQRGEIRYANLDPTQGREQQGLRPVLAVSHDRFNFGPAELVIVVPLSRTERGLPTHVRIDPPEGGVTATSYAMCEAVRSISKSRLDAKPLGSVSDATMRSVEDRLRILLAL